MKLVEIELAALRKLLLVLIFFNEGKTAKEIGEHFCITRERVYQLKRKAMRRARWWGAVKHHKP